MLRTVRDRWLVQTSTLPESGVRQMFGGGNDGPQLHGNEFANRNCPKIKSGIELGGPRVE